MFSSWLKFLRLRPIDQRYALLEACVIGVISALAALTLKEGIAWVGSYRVNVANEHGWLVLPLIGFLFGGLTGACLQWFAPEAGGGGVPQVKAVLAQLPMSLSVRGALVKMLGTILVLGAGFTLGRRGPTVHIGAALAAQLSVWLPTSPQHRRQMIAAGAAAGLAAGFNTPIAGIFFVVEELMRDISGLTLETAILASFTGAVVSRLLGASNINLSGLASQNAWEVSFTSPEIPFFLLLGISAGILGGIFNRGILFSLHFYQSLQWSLPLRIAIAGLISGSIVAAFPPFFRDNAGLRDILITGQGGWEITAIALIAYFFLILVAYGSGAPGGLFSPALVLGSALGYLIGVAEVSLMGIGSENTYALAGMGAVFTAVVRVPVTAIVIVFELTASFELVLPLMISCATAYVVAESVSRGSLYQQLLAAQGINLREENQVDPLLARFTAAEVMQSPVDTLSPNLTLDETYKAFSNSAHHGFPVVEKGKLVGIITQTDLGKFLGRSPSLKLQQMMTSRPIRVNPAAPLQEVLYLLNRHQLSHLPVTKGERLVGIITRSDIIRAEVEELHESRSLDSPLQQRVIGEPSYAIYQTRSPAVGKSRILAPIANSDTAIGLTEFASAIAQFREAELELLHLIKVPRNVSPHQVWVNPAFGRELLQHTEALARQQQIPVHTELRTAHNRRDAILEVIQQRQISLLIMGWQGNKNVLMAGLFGTVAETLVRRAPCDVILIKPGRNVQPKALSLTGRWLIPVAMDEAQASKLIELLPQLVSGETTPDYILCSFQTQSPQANPAISLQEMAKRITEQLQAPAETISLTATSRENGVLQLAQEKACDVIVLWIPFKKGSREPTFDKNFPAMIANRFPGTVIFIRPSGVE